MTSSTRRQSVVRQLADGESSFECPLCTRPNVADKWMVQCDVCACWIHFSCAGVDDTISNKPYTCVRCAPPPPPAGSKSCRSSTSSVRAARRELELQRLAEEKAFQERLLKERQEEEEAMQRKMMEQEQERRKKAMQEKLEFEKQFIERKFDLLRAELDEDDDDRSVRSRRSTRSVQRTVQTWVREQEKLTMATGTGIETIPTGPTSNTGTLPKTTSAAIHGQAVNTSQVGLPAATTIDLTALNISPPSSRLKDQLSSVNMIISPPAQSTNQRNSLAACLPQQVGQHQQQKNAGQHQPRQHRESSAFVDTTDTVILASKTLSQGMFFDTAPLITNQSQTSFITPPQPTTGEHFGRLTRPSHVETIPENPAQKKLLYQPFVENTSNTLGTLTAPLAPVFPSTHQCVTSVSSYSHPITTPVVFDRVVQSQNVSSVTQSASGPSVVQPQFAGVAGIHPNAANSTASFLVSHPPPNMAQFEMPSMGIQPPLPPLAPLAAV
nr:uncharacterized protein LOC115260683 [Aedes albopictus]XP_029717706.1 uncharacterized protein LOC115260683 [Aedes albopictus]